MLLGYLSVGLFLTTVGANNIAHLVGTWTTKSRKVITGPVCEMNKQLSQECQLSNVSYVGDRDSMIRSTMNSWNPTCPVSRTPLPMMVTMKRLTIAPLPTVSPRKTCLHYETYLIFE